MFDFVEFLIGAKVVSFFLLFIRVGAFLVFVPFFNSDTIPPTIKTTIAFYLAVLFFPLVDIVKFELTPSNIFIATISEVTFGFLIGFIIKFVFAFFQYAGELIAFVMNFTIASSFDPQSASSASIINRFLYFFIIIAFLFFDGHHMILLFVSNSIHTITLGGFALGDNYFKIITNEMLELFIMSFSIAFPILAISLLSDVIFGMIMKTMPSFNLLIVGTPAKTMVSFVVFIVVLAPMIAVFRDEFLKIFRVLSLL